MNTVEKGNKFEEKALEIIKNAIEEEKIGLKDHIQIFQKKSYYSHARKKDIQFDLSIEIWPPDAKRFVLVYLIECKDYSKSIPVDDIEEFFSKASQVAEGRFKCVFIANNSFQEGGYNFAESKGMMLIRGESSADYEIILHKKNRKGENILSINNNDAISEDLGVELLEKIIDKKINNAFKLSSDPQPLVDYNISRLSKAAIEAITEQKLEKISPQVFGSIVGLTKQKLEKYITEVLEVRIEVLPYNSTLLGSCDFKNKVIGIHPSIGENRYLFILAHELGHFILHKDLKIEQEVYEGFSDSQFNFRKNKHDLDNPKNWIEWQANYFASSLVLPKAVLVARLLRYQENNNLTQGKLYWDDQPDNWKNVRKTVDHLAYFFSVTKTSIIYRLKELNMLIENSRLKSLGEIISEYENELFF